MDTERSYLNTLKGVLIVLVVIGHFGQTISNLLPENLSFIGHGIVLFIYLFHMPMFMFVSGYLSKNAEKRRHFAIRDLFIPYILFQTLVGFCLLVLIKSGKALQNPFLPQMGAWYLLALFGYRLVLPELARVKGIMIFSALLTIFTCVLTGIGSEFALKKSLGFLVYFMAGFFYPRIKRNMPKTVARIILLTICAVIIVAAKRVDYSIALSVLSRGATINSFDSWYYAPIIYLCVFVLTSFLCVLVLNAIPEKSNWLERQGKDTMPMYLSHLILFMAVGYLVDKGNRLIAIGVSSGCIFFSLWVFSSEPYRKTFNKVLLFTRKFFKET